MEERVLEREREREREREGERESIVWMYQNDFRESRLLLFSKGT